jgi:hypothetical protein
MFAHKHTNVNVIETYLNFIKLKCKEMVHKQIFYMNLKLKLH